MTGTSSSYGENLNSDIVAYDWACADRKCSTQLVSYAFTDTEFLTQEVLSVSGFVYEVQYVLDSAVTADRFEQIFTTIALPGTRTSISGFVNYHPDMVVGSSRPNATTVNGTFDISKVTQPKDAAYLCGFVPPAGEYEATAVTLKTFWDSVFGAGPQVGGNVQFDATVYTSGATNLQVVKTVDGETIVDRYYIFAPGYPDHLTEYVLSAGETVEAGTCTVPVATVDCDSLVDNTFEVLVDADTNNYTNLIATLAGSTENGALLNNSSDGIIIDGVDWVLSNVPIRMYVNTGIIDGDSITQFSDNLGNISLSTTVWDEATDPTGTTFTSALVSELENFLTLYGIPYTAVIAPINSVGGGNLSFTIQVAGTNSTAAPQYLQSISFSNGSNLYFYVNNDDYETDYQFSPSLPPTATLTSIDVQVVATVGLGDFIILGGVIDNKYGGVASPYLPINGNGIQTTYTYNFPITGTDIFAGAYTITTADVNAGVFAWIYFSSSGVDNTQIDGVRYRFVYTDGDGGTLKSQVTIGCNDQRRDDLLADIEIKLTPSLEKPGGTVIDSEQSLSGLVGLTTIKSFSVKPLIADATSNTAGTIPTGVPAYDISFDNGNNWLTYIDGCDSWGEGNESPLDIVNIRIRPSLIGDGGRVLIIWEI